MSTGLQSLHYKKIKTLPTGKPTANRMMKSLIKILLIEDDAQDANIMKLRLERAPNFNHTLEHTTRLENAIERISRGNIDVILTDLILPDSEAKNTISKLKDKAPHIPILVLTGIDDENLEIEFIRSGIEAYLLKSELGQSSLVRMIRYAVERNQLVKELQGKSDDLNRLVLLDSLTELLNRRGFETILTRELAWSRRYKTPLSAYIIQIDDISTTDQTSKELILKHASKTLQNSLRTTDYIARLSDREFMILLPHTKPDPHIKITKRLQTAFKNQPVCFPTGSVILKTIIGSYPIADPEQSEEQIIKAIYASLTTGQKEHKKSMTARK